VQPPEHGAKSLKALTPAQEKMMAALANVHRAHGDAFGECGVSAVEWDIEAAKVWAGTGIPVAGKTDTFRKHRKDMEELGHVRKGPMSQWFLTKPEDRKTPEGQ
jgi:hypothetical protein